MSRRKPKLPIPKLLGLAGVFLILATLTAVAWSSTLLQRTYSHYQIERRIRRSQSEMRTTLGRLSEAPYAPLLSGDRVSEELGRANLMMLALPESPRTRYLKSLVDVGTRNWERAVEELTDLAQAKNPDADVLNDLGVVLLERSPRDATNLFKALDQFELAEKIDPKAPEPHYNRLLVLRKLCLKDREEAEEKEYTRLEPGGSWHNEILNPPLAEDEILTQLRAALAQHDDDSAIAIFRKAPELCRKIAMQYAMNPIEASENDRVATFVGRAIKQLYDDDTVAFMLSPLDGPNRSELIEARRLVREGADHYLRSDLKASLEAYEKAAELAADKHSAFDEVWIDLNRANTEIRRLDINGARATLRNVVRQARQQNFKWVLAAVLSSYGSITSLNSSFTEMMGHLQESAQISDEIGTPNAAARARFYMMGQRFFAGDLDGSLQNAIQSLGMGDPQDHIRLSSVMAFVGPILYKKGLPGYAVLVGEESVAQASRSGIASLIAGTNSSLALIRESISQQKAADEALARSEQAVKNIPEKERLPVQVNLNNAKARVLLHRGLAPQAEALLEQSRQAVSEQLASVTWLKSETSMLLGQMYVQTNKSEEAKRAFQQAVAIVEDDTDFVKSERNRIAFDDGRRELYDSAIGFEYGHGSTDAAWTYLQKYRAKLFIEQLAQFNPDIERVHAIALDRAQVQKSIPDDLQVVEYAVLPERLLIWVVNNKAFETRSVSISRESVEETVRRFLAKLRAQAPVTEESTELYKVLVSPIEPLLDPKRALAIIPDRALHGLPFAAIGMPESGYLIERFAILESPTLTHLLAVDRTKAPRDSVVAFASRADDIGGNNEISAMKTIYRKVSAFSGAEVTKAGFLEAAEHASVFHYAGHSAHDAADPLRSSILLDGDKQGPNSVTAADIVGHKLLPNSVVILSSCDSSVGNSKDGIGIRGLTSAFLVSGAGSVVGSLWPVESMSTSQMMIAFHRAFAFEKLSIADAMRKAQVAFLAANPKQRHPYYWSGFVVTGNLSALR